MKMWGVEKVAAIADIPLGMHSPSSSHPSALEALAFIRIINKLIKMGCKAGDRWGWPWDALSCYLVFVENSPKQKNDTS